jgi:hypothetical protein
MNRATRLSLIAVMLLAATALGAMAYKAIYPDLPPAPEPVKEAHPPPRTLIPEPSEPKPNPYYQKLVVDLERHERHCLELGKQSVIVLEAKSQTQAERQARECWNLVKIEREYVKDFPAKTIQ